MATDTAPAPVYADVPKPAFEREYLRKGLPGIYRDEPNRDEQATFAMRFMAALEDVLDPVVAIVDLFPAHLDLAVAPDELVTVIGAWLGLDFDRGLDAEARRRLARQATRITRERGTMTGIRHVLELAFPEVDGLTVEDSGGVSFGEQLPPVPRRWDPMLWIKCPADVPREKLEAIRRTVEQLTPVHVRIEMVLEEGGPAT